MSTAVTWLGIVADLHVVQQQQASKQAVGIVQGAVVQVRDISADAGSAVPVRRGIACLEVITNPSWTANSINSGSKHHAH
jgi:hypothetical protein